MMMLSPPVGSVAASLVNVKALLVAGVSDGGVGGVGVGVGKELEAAGVTGVGVTSWMKEDGHWKVTICVIKIYQIDECAYLHAAVSVCRNVACNFFACLHAAACSNVTYLHAPACNNAPYIFLLLLAYLPAAECSMCFLSSCCCMQLMLHAYLSAVACSLPIFLLLHAAMLSIFVLLHAGRISLHQHMCCCVYSQGMLLKSGNKFVPRNFCT